MLKKPDKIVHSKPYISKGDVEIVNGVLTKGMIAEGAYCNKLKQALKREYNCKEVILTNSGSSSLYLALKLLNLSHNSEILLPTYVCRDVIDVVYATGYTPVLCDIGEFWNMTPENIEGKISKRTGAIIIPHNLGICLNVEPFKKHNIPIIEDCSQCFAPSDRPFFPGSVGDFCVLSFNATKCLTSGEGGALIVNNENFQWRFEMSQVFSHILRMSDLQASLCNSQLKKYGTMLSKRKTLAEIYFENINMELSSHFSKVKQDSVFFRFLLFNPQIEFKHFSQYMFKHGIIVRKGIDNLLHRKYNFGHDSEFINAIRCFNSTISIPIYPALNRKTALTISDVVNKYYDGFTAPR